MYLAEHPRVVFSLPTAAMSPPLVTVTRLNVRFSPDKSNYFQSTSTLAQTAQPIETYISQNVQWQREYKHLGVVHLVRFI